MIALETMKKGLVVHDPTRHGAPERQYFELLEPTDPEVGPFPARQVSTGSKTSFRLGDLKTLRAVEEKPIIEMGLDCFLNREIRIRTKWGGEMSGKVTEIRYKELEVLGEKYKVPVSMQLAGESIEMVNVERIEWKV